MVTIIPKPPKKVPYWRIIFFYLSIVLLLAVIIVYFILDGFQGKSEATLNNLEQEISNVATPNQKMKDDIIANQNKIEDFSKLFAAYPKTSQFFKFLEEKTIPEVWFTDLDLEPDTLQVKLGGQAENFQKLAQQIYIFQGEKDKINKVNLTNISLGDEGQAQFILQLSLSPKLFKNYLNNNE